MPNDWSVLCPSCLTRFQYSEYGIVCPECKRDASDPEAIEI